LLDTIVEVQDENGKWVPAPNLKPTPQDIENLYEVSFD
jgi:hypothetical protein